MIASNIHQIYKIFTDEYKSKYKIIHCSVRYDDKNNVYCMVITKYGAFDIYVSQDLRNFESFMKIEDRKNKIESL